MDSNATITHLAADILNECKLMEESTRLQNIEQPSLNSGCSSAFWSNTGLDPGRSRALGLLNQLSALIQGPHEYIHELVSCSWDHGALYAALQSKVLESIAAAPGGKASLDDLSIKCGIPGDKLTRILALLRCRFLVEESATNTYSLTAVSEDLIRDDEFKAWVEFQMFETRVASAHLADALASKPNTYANGISAFKQAWGKEMYEWHSEIPEKGDRFRRAMRGVSKSLDPADSLLKHWFEDTQVASSTNVIELGGRYGFGSTSLVQEQPELSFEVRCPSKDLIDRGKAIIPAADRSRVTFAEIVSSMDFVRANDSTGTSVYVIRNFLWNWSDDDAVKLLQSMLPTLRASKSSTILITDGVSPLANEFPPHVEVAYRRRDITTMTMHNTKQRSQAEWLQLFALVDPNLKVKTMNEASAHVSKALWALSLS